MRKLIMAGAAMAATFAAGGWLMAAPGDARGNGRGMLAADANQDGKISRAEMQAQAATRFAEMDVNKDGTLTQADRDAQRAAKQAERFAAADANKDGMLSLAEFSAMRAPGAERRRGSGPEAGPRGPKGGRYGGRDGMPGGALGGSMTKAQFEAASMARFDRMDSNKDGTLDNSELAAARQMRRDRGGRGRAGPGSGPSGGSSGAPGGAEQMMLAPSAPGVTSATPAT